MTYDPRNINGYQGYPYDVANWLPPVRANFTQIYGSEAYADWLSFPKAVRVRAENNTTNLIGYFQALPAKPFTIEIGLVPNPDIYTYSGCFFIVCKWSTKKGIWHGIRANIPYGYWMDQVSRIQMLDFQNDGGGQTEFSSLTWVNAMRHGCAHPVQFFKYTHAADDAFTLSISGNGRAWLLIGSGTETYETDLDYCGFMAQPTIYDTVGTMTVLHWKVY